MVETSTFDPEIAAERDECAASVALCQPEYAVAEHDSELPSVKSGRVNFGVLPEAMVNVEVVELIVEAGVGTRVTVAHVSTT